MGLLDKKSESNQIFRVDTGERKVIVYTPKENGGRDVSYHGYYYEFCEFINIINNDQDYPISILIDEDLSKHDPRFVSFARKFLHELGLINETDRQLLIREGIPEHKIMLSLEDLHNIDDISTRTFNVMFDNGYRYLIEFLYSDFDRMMDFSIHGGYGYKTLLNLENALNKYGFHIPNFSRTYEIDKINKRKDKEISSIEGRIQKIIASRKKYEAEIEALQKKIEESDLLLEEETLRLEKAKKQKKIK